MSVHYKGVEMIRNESNANINLDELDVDTDVQEIISHTVTEELAYAAKILLDGGYDPMELSDQFEFAFYRGTSSDEATLKELERLFLELADMER
jgi:hypothetical protein